MDEARETDARLHCAVLVTRPPDAGARRLLSALLDDPRFAVTAVGPVAPASEAVGPATAALMAVERRLLPVPERVPLPDLPPLDLLPPDRVSEAQADVILDLAGSADPAALAGHAVHGLWQIVVPDPARGPRAATLAGQHSSEIALVRHLADGGGPRRVAQAVYDTKPLVTHSVAYAQEKAAQMILRELARCHRDGAPAEMPGPVQAAGDGGRPGAAGGRRGHPAGYVLRTTALALRRLRHRLAAKAGRYPQSFGLRLGPGTVEAFDPAALRPVPMPPGAVLWADPFLIRHEGALYCFFEDVDPRSGLGHVSVGRVGETGLTDLRVALRQPHHMSFPFVFHHDGALLMMPEVHAAGRLEIWRCTRFPDGWTLHATAFEGTPVADSVLARHDGAWWLFTHITRDRFGDYCSDLHVFRVDGPDLRSLVPHRLNPVVTGSDTARGAGRVHATGGRLLRLSQDNSGPGYGWGLNVMEITRLDLDHYEERRIRHVTPGFAPGVTGCHHLDAEGGQVVIDVRRG